MSVQLPSLQSLKAAERRAYATAFVNLAVSHARLFAGHKTYPNTKIGRQIYDSNLSAGVSKESAMHYGNAEALSALTRISDAFLSEGDSSVYDALSEDFQPGELHAEYAVATSGATAHEVAEGAAKPVARMSFAPVSLRSRKITSLVVISKELLRFGNAEAVVEREMRKAVRSETDAVIVPILMSGAAQVVASGSDAVAIRDDLRRAAQALPAGSDSRWHWILPPVLCRRLSVLGDLAGASAFPSMGPTGGMIGNAPAHASDALASSGSVLLVNAANFVSAADPLSVAASGAASVEMVGTPTNASSAGSPPEAVEANLVSMFQANSVCIRAERALALERLHAGVIEITGAADLWGLEGSPLA